MPTAHGACPLDSPAARSGACARLHAAWRDLGAASLLVGLAMLLLGRQIALGGTLYNDDIVLQSIPVHSWYSEALKAGRLPIWSPAILGGFPLAFGQYGFFHPPDVLLFRLLDPDRAFHLSLALHLALAGCCAYWYCRVLGLRRIPSLLAAVAYQMGNEALAWPANGYITRTLFALPALLAVIELTFRRSLRHWLLVPPIVVAALLGGYAQFLLFSLAVAGPYALVLAVRGGEGRGEPRGREDTKLGGERAEGGRETGRTSPQRSPRAGAGLLRAELRPRVYPLLLLALGIALGFGLAAVRVAPTLAVTALSTRAGGLDMAAASLDFIEPWALLVGYLLPAALELPDRLSQRPDFLGAPALLLAALAVASIGRLGRVGLFHVGLLAVATVLSLGESTPAYALLLQMPFFSYFRGPSRLSLVAALAIAVLAAIALDRRLAAHLPRQGIQHRVVVLAGAVAGVVAVVAVASSISFQFGRDPLSEALRAAVVAGGWDPLNSLRPRVAAPLLGLVAAPLLVVACARGRISHRTLELFSVALTAATLVLMGWIQNPWLPPGPLHEPPRLLKLIAADPERFRVFSWAPRVSTYNVGAFYTGVVGRPPSREFEEHYLRQFIPPNLGMLFGVATADGYEALQSRRQALAAHYMGSERVDYARYADGGWADWSLHQRSLHYRLELLAALNVGYLLHAHSIQDPRLEWLGEVAVQIYPGLPADARVHLYRIETALPRAFVVPRSEVIGDERQVLEALMAGSVELTQAVILESEPREPVGALLTPAGSYVETLDYRDDRVEISTRTDGSGFLVLMDSPLPGWTATVDGRPEPILAANFAGRAVPLDGAGEHLVVFSYEAPLWREGLAASLASATLLVACSGLLVIGDRARRRRAHRGSAPAVTTARTGHPDPC